MTVLIIASKTDPAAMNIFESLVTNYSFKEQTDNTSRTVYKRDGILLTDTDSDILRLHQLETFEDVESVVCISRHSSESGKPTLTAHVPGNLGSRADMGGNPKSLAWADPKRLKSALIELDRSARQLGLDEYSVSLEATHHGPTELQTPFLFVEIGSTKKQWEDPKAGEAVASAAFKAATDAKTGKLAVGFGGGHYSPKHTSIVIDDEFAIGHILPEYFFDEYDPQVVRQAFMRTAGGCNTAVIDWKGLKSPARRQLVSTLEEMGVEIERA